MLSKTLIPTLFTLAVLVLVAGCADNPVAPVAPDTGGDDAVASASKFGEEIVWIADLDNPPFPYEDCGATGATMQNHGLLEVHELRRTTPSGTEIISSWVDYQALGGVTLENLDTGEIWTLVTGHNPATYVLKEGYEGTWGVDGLFMLAYQWSELYKSGKETLHIHLKGHLKLNPDGTAIIERESYTCR